MAQADNYAIGLTRRSWLGLGIATALGTSLGAVPVHSQSPAGKLRPSHSAKARAFERWIVSVSNSLAR
jgi:hypothetical protein